MDYEELEQEVRTLTNVEVPLDERHYGRAKENPSCLSEDQFIPPGWTVAVRGHPRYLSTDLHRHAFLELVYVYDGQCMQYIENTQVSMKKGDVCLLAPNVKHAVSVKGEDHLVINILARRSTFDTAFANLLSGQGILAEFFARILYERQTKQYILFHTKEDDNLRRVVLDMFHEFRRNAKYGDLMLKSYLMLFLGQLLRDHEQDARIINPTASQRSDILGLLQYLQGHYQSVTLSQVAQRFGFNYSQTSRLIKAYTGRTFSELRREMRVHKARELLVNPSLSIGEIVETMGYHDISHFYRDFKQFYGVAPVEYRAKHIPEG